MKATLPEILAAIEQTRSMSEGRRYVSGGHVSVNGVVVTDVSQKILVNTGDIIKVGKTEIIVPESICEEKHVNDSNVPFVENQKKK